MGCSPAPLTVQEIEQALTIKPGSFGLEKKVFASPNLNRLCGPIIEIVDGYVQFVHFTVKEYVSENPVANILANERRYLFSHDIDGHIDLVHATLDLAICCTTFLSQTHYNVDILSDDDGFTNLLQDRSYRLHYFAVNGWFELVKNYLELAENKILPQELVRCLKTLMIKRRNDEFAAERDTSIEPTYLRPIKADHPDLYDFLVSIAQFHERCSQTWYHVNERIPPIHIPGQKTPAIGNKWNSFDPLTIFLVSAKIYRELDSTLCHSSHHQPNCIFHLNERNFGKRLFKCGFLNCPFQQHGFESKAQRAKHEKEHTRPWKCNVSGCEYENIGFISHNMRDQHEEKAHRDKAPPRKLPEDSIGNDELLAVVLDLVRNDEVEIVERLLPRHYRLYFYESLGRRVGELGSVPMAQMITRVCQQVIIDMIVTPFYAGAIKTRNIELIDWIVNSNQMPLPHEPSVIVAAFLGTNSEEMWRLCEQFMVALSPAGAMDQRLYHDCFEERVISGTSRIAKRETALLSLWECVGRITKIKVAKLSYALGAVARTTCSVRLATALLQYGADVNGQKGLLAVSPLQFAARKSSIENAEFMRFLLSAGADPEQVSRSLKPSDEIGAKKISRWLGITWNELVEQTRNQRRSVDLQLNQ